MSIVIKHYGRIVNGVKQYYNPALYKETITSLEGKEFEEVIKQKHKRVSEDAHGYYRGGVLGTALEFEMFGGWTKDDLHDFFAKMFLSYKKSLILKYDDGTECVETIKKTQSTSGLNSKEMTEFVDKVIQWLAEQGIVVLPPEQYVLGKYKTETKHVKPTR